MARIINMKKSSFNTLREGQFQARIQSVSNMYNFRDEEVCDVVFYIPELDREVTRKIWKESSLFNYLIEVCGVNPEKPDLDDFQGKELVIELSRNRGYFNVTKVMDISTLVSKQEDDMEEVEDLELDEELEEDEDFELDEEELEWTHSTN